MPTPTFSPNIVMPPASQTIGTSPQAQNTQQEIRARLLGSQDFADQLGSRIATHQNRDDVSGMKGLIGKLSEEINTSGTPQQKQTFNQRIEQMQQSIRTSGGDLASGQDKGGNTRSEAIQSRAEQDAADLDQYKIN